MTHVDCVKAFSAGSNLIGCSTDLPIASRRTNSSEESGRSMVDRYAKLATENVASAAARSSKHGKERHKLGTFLSQQRIKASWRIQLTVDRTGALTRAIGRLIVRRKR